MISGYNGRTLSHSIDGRTLKHDDTNKQYHFFNGRSKLDIVKVRKLARTALFANSPARFYFPIIIMLQSPAIDVLTQSSAKLWEVDTMAEL